MEGNRQVVLIALAVGILACSILVGQQRIGSGVLSSREVHDYDGAYLGGYSSSHALLIGVSDYQDQAWPDLTSIPEELKKVQNALEETGFEVAVALDLDSKGLVNSFESFVDAHGLEGNARLLFFFAGHGYTRETVLGRKGYLVPSDAANPNTNEPEFVTKALEMGQILEWSRRIEAKHAIFLFDSCFSGSVFDSRGLPDQPPHIDKLTMQPVRQFITSGSANEKVPAKSVFVELLVRGLRGEAESGRPDGFITGTELGKYLYDELVLEYKTGQTPQYGKIRDVMLDRGDFVFLLPKDKRNAVANASNAARKRKPLPEAPEFTDIDAAYKYLMEQSETRTHRVAFNEVFPGSVQVLADTHEVPGAFTREGWSFISGAIDRLKADEGFRERIGARYRREFIGHWTTFLRKATVRRHENLTDAVDNLARLSSNRSELLALVWLVAHHTTVEDSEIADRFQPVRTVVPYAVEQRFVSSANEPFMSALLDLQSSLEHVLALKSEVRTTDHPSVQEALKAVSTAKTAARRLAQQFNPDPATQLDRTLLEVMESPLDASEAVLRRIDVDYANRQAEALCAKIESSMQNFPLRSDSSVDGTLEEMGTVFRPGDGALWLFYEGTLRSYVDQVGDRFVQRSDPKIRVTDRFLTFFNRATRLSAALYPVGSREPRLVYSVQALPAENVRSLALTLDGQSLLGGRNGGGPMEFVWPGAGVSGAQLAGSLGGPEVVLLSYRGLWAPFHFFAEADRVTSQGGRYLVEWDLRAGETGEPLSVEGQPVTFRFELEMRGAPPVFNKAFFDDIGCVPTITD